MSFSYNFATAPLIANVRLLISDTINNPPSQPAIFQDEEITALYNIQQSTWQTSMFFSWPAGQTLPSNPVSTLRVAALALDALASNQARLASVLRILDVTLNPALASKALRDQANEFRTIEDNAGAFAIIEQCPTSWAFQDRFWKQVQRQASGGALS